MKTRDEIKAALTSICPNVFYAKATKQPDEYIVWDMDGQQADALYADEAMDDQVLSGTIDLFTKKINRDGSSPTFKKIHSALRAIELSFSLNSKQVERDTGFTHWEWVFEYVGDEYGND